MKTTYKGVPVWQRTLMRYQRKVAIWRKFKYEWMLCIAAMDMRELIFDAILSQSSLAAKLKDAGLTRNRDSIKDVK